MCFLAISDMLCLWLQSPLHTCILPLCPHAFEFVSSMLRQMLPIHTCCDAIYVHRMWSLKHDTPNTHNRSHCVCKQLISGGVVVSTISSKDMSVCVRSAGAARGSPLPNHPHPRPALSLAQPLAASAGTVALEPAAPAAEPQAPVAAAAEP